MKPNQVYYAEAQYERPWWDKVVSAILGFIFCIGIWMFIQWI